MLTPPHRFAGEAPAHTARDRSWSSATGSPVTPPRRWVPGSVLGPFGPPGGTSKVCGGTLAPCTAATALRPWPPLGGPLAPARRCSGASARPPCGRLSAVDLRPPAPLASGCRRQAAARRSAAAPAPRSPRYALRAARTAPALGPLVALGLLRVSLRLTLRATAGSFPALLRRRLGGSPPGRPRPRPALPRPSVGWSPGRATGSAPPAWGLERPGGPLSQATGPRRGGTDTVGGYRGGIPAGAGRGTLGGGSPPQEICQPSPPGNTRRGGEGGAAPGGF